MLKINFIPTYDEVLKYDQTLILDYRGCSLIYFVDSFSGQLIIDMRISHLGINHREKRKIDLRIKYTKEAIEEINKLLKTLPDNMYKKLIDKINSIEKGE